MRRDHFHDHLFREVLITEKKEKLRSMIKHEKENLCTFCLIGCRRLFFTDIRSRAAECSNCWQVDENVPNVTFDTRNISIQFSSIPSLTFTII